MLPSLTHLTENGAHNGEVSNGAECNWPWEPRVLTEAISAADPPNSPPLWQGAQRNTLSGINDRYKYKKKKITTALVRMMDDKKHKVLKPKPLPSSYLHPKSQSWFSHLPEQETLQMPKRGFCTFYFPRVIMLKGTKRHPII